MAVRDLTSGLLIQHEGSLAKNSCHGYWHCGEDEPGGKVSVAGRVEFVGAV